MTDEEIIQRDEAVLKKADQYHQDFLLFLQRHLELHLNMKAHMYATIIAALAVVAMLIVDVVRML